MKDGLGNPEMDYGGYDYSGENPTQIGLFDSSEDHVFTYRIYVNRKNVSMTNVTVTDTLPDGMYLQGGSGSVICRKMDGTTMSTTDEVLEGAVVIVSGQNISVFLGDIDYPVEIAYEVFVPAQSSVRLRNHSEIVYTQDGQTYKESRDYIAQGNDYSAANGVKSVDKTVISNDSDDQWVTYYIKFWNENGFAAGEINLTDDLDDHVSFLYASDNEYFNITVDENDPTVLHIRNTADIPSSKEVYVSFVCDMTNVPAGYTVYNTVGGNTTQTTKEEEETTTEETTTEETATTEETTTFAAPEKPGNSPKTGERPYVTACLISLILSLIGLNTSIYLKIRISGQDK